MLRRLFIVLITFAVLGLLLIPLYTNTVNSSDYSINYEMDDQDTFWVYSMKNQDYYEVDATIKAITQHAYIFVANDQLPQYLPTVDEMEVVFEDVYNSNVPYFGIPPDVDNNGKVIVLLLDIEDGRTDDSYVAGFFDPLHEIDPSLYNPNSIARFSEYKDMIFVDTLAADQGVASSTLVHEFQHLIHYKTDEDETTWLNEGASVYSETRAGFSDDYSEYFMEKTDTSLTYWTNELDDYGAVFVFMNYLSSRFGPNVVGEIVNNTKNGGESIIDVLSSNYDYEGSFKDLFVEWTIAYTLNLPENEYPAYNYQALETVISDITEMNTYPYETSEQLQFWSTDVYHYLPDINTGNSALEINFDGESGSSGKILEFREFTVTIGAYSEPEEKWLFDTIEMNFYNDFAITLPDFSRDQYSEVYLWISSTTGTSSGDSSVEDIEAISDDYTLHVDIVTSTLMSDLAILDDQTISLVNISVWDTTNTWNTSNIEFATYNVIDENQTLVTGYEGTINYNASINVFENISIDVSNLDPGSYQIELVVTNATNSLIGYSTFFIVSEGGVTTTSETPTSTESTTLFTSSNADTTFEETPIPFVNGFYVFSGILIFTVVSRKSRK